MENTERKWNHWLILTSDRIYPQDVFEGTYEEAIAYCDKVYQGDYFLDKDNRNDNHPFWARRALAKTKRNGGYYG